MPHVPARAANGDVELAYERYNSRRGEPLLLIMGFSVQRHFWPAGLCDELERNGFDVLRFDNRDCGQSTHLDWLPVPPLGLLLGAPKLVAPYRLSDMAADTVAVLDAAGWERATVMGVSMGGMIAQTMAIRYPHRVKSLVSISSTPAPHIGQPTLRARRVLTLRPGRTAEEVADRLVWQSRIIGSPRYPIDEPWLRDYAHSAFARGHNPDGGRRQLGAVLASGSRLRALRSVESPTLVVHGADDPLIRPVGGRATARAVRNARLVVHRGMGHDLPAALWPEIARDVAALADRAG
ncbi:alpha/beta hydrolase [Rhodococcus sp. NCIMB 12038]|nr:alpha/beta hydrolase [Rhodococcus sp. NCIMB 12038]